MKKILIIDDEKDFCFFLKKNLEGVGRFDVAICHDGKDGLRLAENMRPDLILLDILMPRMDGIEVAKQLKANPVTSYIQIVFLTAVVKEEEVGKREFIGGWRYIAKPVKIDELVDLVDTLTLLR